MIDTEHLPRNIKIDWLRFQVSSYRPNFFRELRNMIGLPFERKQSSLQDARETNILALNKVWHEVYEFQNSWIGIKHPPAGSDEPILHFVDLNGRTVSALDFAKISALLYYSNLEAKFIGNRIDIALDFPVLSPRLSEHNWELFVEDGLLSGYRSVKRISNRGSTSDKTTVYLGSRESSKFVRMYAKTIEDVDYDRLEIEFKRERATEIMQHLVSISVDEFPKFLNGRVCGEIYFKRQRSDSEFFKKYAYGAIFVSAPILHLDIEKSIAFVQRHAATLAMIAQFMGSDRYDEFMNKNLEAGKLRMASRHRSILSNAKACGVALALFLLLIGQSSASAIAAPITCPAPVPLTFQATQKFPIDIVQPTPAEQAYLNNVGNGCFQINAGVEFQSICLPGMIVNALRPFVIMGLGIKFIFSD